MIFLRLKKLIRSAMNRVLGFIGFSVLRTSEHERLKRIADADPLFDVEFLLSLPEDVAGKALQLIPLSKSQLRQDLLALQIHGFKRNGYFVEFGATNGIDLSNTYLLESEFGWKGILAEPARVWAKDLKANRPNTLIEDSCVWKESNEYLEFNETASPELSTVSYFSELDIHKDLRSGGKKYKVKTISLLDLLRKHGAPPYIDYLSVDTEGSEFDILNSFDYSEYVFGVISCEHNGSDNRERVFDLLTSHGYERVLASVSRFDDWYVHSSLYNI